jgi:20S proteasome alpha/beta subunit
MTVCVAAICDDGKAIVLAADRMFTAGAPVNVEFETAEKKIERLAPSCMSLFAGDSASGNEIIQKCIASMAGATQPSIAAASDAMKAAYIAVRQAKVRERVLLPTLGPDFARGEALGATIPQYLAAHTNLYQQLLFQMNQFQLGVELLIAGIDAQGAGLRFIGNPGTDYHLEKLGFSAIGSGGQHAQSKLCLCAQNRSVPLPETLYRVYEAKRAAEVAQGVGNRTDMAVVTKDGATDCSPATLNALSKAFDEAQNKLPGLDAIEKTLSDSK